MWDCSGGLAGRAARMQSPCKFETAIRGYKYLEVSEVFLVMWVCLNFRLRSNGFLFVTSDNYNLGFALSSGLRFMACVGETLLVEGPGRKRPLGRPDRRWEDNIKMNLQ